MSDTEARAIRPAPSFIRSMVTVTSVLLLLAVLGIVLFTMLRSPLKDDIAHAPLPGGPKGQFGMHTYTSHVIPSYSKNQKAAKDLLRFIHTQANYEQWFTTGQGFYTPGTTSWETHAQWKKDPVMAPFAIMEWAPNPTTI